MIIHVCCTVASGIQYVYSQDSALVCLHVSLFNFMVSKTLNVSFGSLEITLTLLSSFIKFENPRIIGGSERIMGGS